MPISGIVQSAFSISLEATSIPGSESTQVLYATLGVYFNKPYLRRVLAANRVLVKQRITPVWVLLKSNISR